MGGWLASLDEVTHSLSFFKLRTLIIGLMSTLVFTIWLSWNFAVPFQLQDARLVGWAVAVADVGRLLGAIGLIIVPHRVTAQFYLQCAIGLAGSTLGMAAVLFHGESQNVIVFVSLFLVGFGSNPQVVNAFVNVEDTEETKLNSIAYSSGKFLSFGTCMLVTLVPVYAKNNSWAALLVATIFIFALIALLKVLLDRLYPSKQNKTDEVSEKFPILKNATDAKNQIISVPLFVWVLLVTLNARGNPRSVMISMGPLVFHDHLGLSYIYTSLAYFLPLVLSGFIFPVVSLALSSKLQLLFANLFLSLTVMAFPFMYLVAAASADLCFYGVCAATLEAVRVPLLKSIFAEEYHTVTRMIGLQHFIYTLFYFVSASISGVLYEETFWLPFVVSGVVNFLTGFLIGCIGLVMWEKSARNNTDCNGID